MQKTYCIPNHLWYHKDTGIYAKMQKPRKEFMEQKRLKEWREYRGFKAYKVAEILGIHRVTLGYKENNPLKFKSLEVDKLCELYDITIDQIIF